MPHKFEIPILIKSQQPEVENIEIKEICAFAFVEDVPNEDDEVIDLYEIFKDVQPTLDLSIEFNNTIKIVQQN